MRRILTGLLVCTALLAPSASAAAKKRAKKPKPIENTVASPYWFRYPQFTDAEVRLVVNWFQDTYDAGRRAVSSVPAAIRGELHRGATLTASAIAQLTPPPQDLAAKLPPMPKGYERLLAGPIMVILKTDDHLVVDTLSTRR